MKTQVTPGMLSSMSHLLNCAKARIEAGWNSRSETQQALEFSAALTILREVETRLGVLASDLEEQS